MRVRPTIRQLIASLLVTALAVSAAAVYFSVFRDEVEFNVHVASEDSPLTNTSKDHRPAASIVPPSLVGQVRNADTMEALSGISVVAECGGDVTHERMTNRWVSI